MFFLWRLGRLLKLCRNWYCFKTYQITRFIFAISVQDFSPALYYRVYQKQVEDFEMFSGVEI